MKSKDFVGDPIVNAGIVAIELLCNKEFGKCSEKELKEISNWIIKLYLTPAWQRELRSIFPNSTYIQSAKGYNKKEKSRAFLYNLIENIHNDENPRNPCIFCGSSAHKLAEEKPLTKTQIPLIGSSNFTNFFPSLNNGINLCAKCILAIQFAPITFYKIGGKPCCISCTNEEVLQKFGQESIEYIKRNEVLGAFKSKDSSGTFDEGYKLTQNALFHLAGKIASEYKKTRTLKEGEEIVIYRIDNHNRYPNGISIYKMPSNIFSFVANVLKSPGYKRNWNDFISKNYVMTPSKKKGDDPEESPEKIRKNIIYNLLLDNRSVLKYFIDKQDKKIMLPWEVVEHYMEVARQMNKQRIETIKDIADKIAYCIEKSSNKKRIHEIISAKNLPQFRNELISLSRDWQRLGEKESLIAYDDYVSAILPADYLNWQEIRDLIVIRLYEKLHDQLSTETDKKEAELYEETEKKEADEE